MQGSEASHNEGLEQTLFDRLLLMVCHSSLSNLAELNIE